jgi:tetratricopeptide (TPR) repeat protein
MIWSVWLESGSPTVDLLMKKGVGAMGEGQAEPALAMFNAIIELAPDYAEGWNKRATLHYLMGRFEDSIADCERTLKLEPRHFGALSGLGMIYLQLEQDAKALEAYKRALAVHPQLPRLRSEVERLTKKVRGDRI